MKKNILFITILASALFTAPAHARRQNETHTDGGTTEQLPSQSGSTSNEMLNEKDFSGFGFDIFKSETESTKRAPQPALAQENEKKEANDIISATRVNASGAESALTQEAQENPDLFGPANEKKDIYLNFEGAELKSFIEYIADIKGMNIIPDKSIAGNKISLNFRNPVTKTGAWNAFLTILEMANFSIVKVGNLYRIISRDKKSRQPLPTFIGVKSSTLPDSDANIRYIALLNNLPASDVKGFLQGMLGTGSSLIDPPNINGFIITDCACTIKAAMQVIEQLDQTGLEEAVYVMKLKRATATDVKALFDNLIVKPDGNPLAKLLGKPEDSSAYFTPGTRIIAEERTNSLIMMGQRQALEKIKKFIIDNVDTDLKQAQSPLRIYELQNANAVDLVNILREATNSTNSSGVGQQATKYGAIRDGVKYFKSMTFQADKDSNRLIVSCADENDWLLLKETIKKLDSPQPQVAMQMLIVSIDESNINSLGGQVRNPNQNLLGKMDFQTHSPSGVTQFARDNGGNQKSLLGNLLNSLTVSQGASALSFGTFTGTDGIWGVLQALKTETNASVLSQPFAVTSNCSEAKILVGESTWVENQVTAGTNSLTGKTKANANTTITFTPQVNAEGVIRLKLNADIVEFVAGSNGLSTQQKFLDTTISVANGQVLAIGGFVKTKVTDTGGQTPFFGSIPILGWLAKSLSRTVTKEYIFLFLCPTIIKPRTSPGIGMYSKINLHAAAKAVEDIIQTTKTNDPLHNFIFNSSGENYSHKIIDFANARYQPNNVDIRFDPYYRTESADSKQTIKSLHIDDHESSPEKYSRAQAQKKARSQGTTPTKKAAPAPPAPTETEEDEEEEETAPIVASEEEVSEEDEQSPVVTEKKKEVIPATQPVEPEAITLTQEKSSFNAPQPSQEDENIASFDIESSIADKRQKLRSLLAGNSLNTLLQKKPQDEAPDQMLAEEEKKPESQETYMLSRRQGIKNLLSPVSQTSSSQNSSTATRSRSGLQALLGGSNS